MPCPTALTREVSKISAFSGGGGEKWQWKRWLGWRKGVGGGMWFSLFG